MKRQVKESTPEIVKTTLRLRRELWDKVAHRAIDEKLSLQTIVERALDLYLKGGRK
jgi:predicted HicB family RNase H-like nuclease